MPYKTEAQRKFLHANKWRIENQGEDAEEWRNESRGMKLKRKAKKYLLVEEFRAQKFR